MGICGSGAGGWCEDPECLKGCKRLCATGQFNVQWQDRGREPRSPPDPDYPNGRDLNMAGDVVRCKVDLPYPAKRCGIYIVECRLCGLRMGVTTAGRADDPRSAELPCLYAA